LDEDGEVLDSCGGYYGDDFYENGMSEDIDFTSLGLSSRDELVEMLKNIEVEEPEYN